MGPGTGVAPYVGFLEHREALKAFRSASTDSTIRGLWRKGVQFEAGDLPIDSIQCSSDILGTEMGDILLFFGCRNEKDFLYKERLLHFKESGVLTELFVAMSRTQADKIYVTHKIREHGGRLVDLILNQGAFIFVCGDGNNMAKDVQVAFKTILMEEGHKSDLEAEEILRMLKNENRYVLDVWS